MQVDLQHLTYNLDGMGLKMNPTALTQEEREREKEKHPKEHPKEDDDDDDDRYPVHQVGGRTRYGVKRLKTVPSTQSEAEVDIHAFVSNKNHNINTNTAVGTSPEPLAFQKPVEEENNPGEWKPPGTLECMHQMLDSSFSILERAPHPVHNDRLVSTHSKTGTELTGAAASVWVVRYVDYTSKYRLGFLFNTGAAGVYFNDSTKIVLPADGAVFQYTERRKKDTSNTNAQSQFQSEHSSERHSMTAYPQALQKKVTLLRHFRNYLLEQQQKCGSGQPQEGDAREMEQGHRGGLGLKDAAPTGADVSVPVGKSSIPEDSSEEEMPFLKKWVRTKHAILFRISNRTVQVVFYDRSEVLLSSEAKIITYVSKQGDPSEHSLDQIMHSGRLDVAKRLKYTKDIMFRLINSQHK